MTLRAGIERRLEGRGTPRYEGSARSELVYKGDSNEEVDSPGKGLIHKISQHARHCKHGAPPVPTNKHNESNHPGTSRSKAWPQRNGNNNK